MKDITYFYLQGCPHCIRADQFLQQLMEEKQEYKQIKINRIEESKNAAVASLYDYFYVPCFYVDGQKEHEGTVSLDQVKHVLEIALK